MKGVEYVVTEENQTFGGEHTTECTGAELQCCTSIWMYIMLLTDVTSIYFLKHSKKNTDELEKNMKS